tara:strand:+ start:565 stop:801 length:237 start_codon:yes stop_codon:yes gene_type:complete
MNSDQKKNAARLIWQSVKALEDGSVTPEEGRYLALAGVDICLQLASSADRIWIRVALEGAAITLRGLAKELKEMSNDN